MKDLFFFLFLCLIMASCGSDNNDLNESGNESSDTTAYAQNTYKVYAVPSPAFTPSVLKDLGDVYSDGLIADTKKSKPDFGVSSQKFLNLGIYMTDFSYAHIFQQQSTAIIYLDKIDYLLKDLQLDNPRVTSKMKEFRDNTGNTDSTRKNLNEIQEEINYHLSGNNNETFGFYILTGMYIEGLYLTLSNFEILNDARQRFTPFDDRLKQLLLQQEGHLKALIELAAKNNDENAPELRTLLADIKKQTDNLNLSYTVNKTSGKIERVNLSRANVNTVLDGVKKIRAGVVGK